MGSTNSAPLRERKRQQTHERIRQTAEELFLELGFDQTSLDEIADRADVSRATLFNYFHSKEQLLNEVATAELNWLGKQLARTAADNSPIERVVWLLKQLAQDTLPFGTLTRRVLINALVEPGSTNTPITYLQSMLEQLVIEAQTQHQLRNDMSPAMIAHLITGTYLAAFLGSAPDTEPNEPFVHALETMLRGLIHGIAAHPRQSTGHEDWS